MSYLFFILVPPEGRTEEELDSFVRDISKWFVSF